VFSSLPDIGYPSIFLLTLFLAAAVKASGYYFLTLITGFQSLSSFY
jgi:hypothetical protein